MQILLSPPKNRNKNSVIVLVLIISLGGLLVRMGMMEMRMVAAGADGGGRDVC